MRYYSAKGSVIIIIIIALLLFAVLSAVNGIYIITGILTVVTVYFIWMLFDTYYTLEDGALLYKCALIKGSIAIDTITEIVKGKTQYSGVKPALASKGLIVKYNRWDDIYISPKDAGLFIDRLKEINPDIKVTE
jgi:hypothetical protein